MQILFRQNRLPFLVYQYMLVLSIYLHLHVSYHMEILEVFVQMMVQQLQLIPILTLHIH